MDDTFLEIFGYRITGWPATITLIGIMWIVGGAITCSAIIWG